MALHLYLDSAPESSVSSAAAIGVASTIPIQYVRREAVRSVATVPREGRGAHRRWGKPYKKVS
jgi:hypothetical protein